MRRALRFASPALLAFAFAPTLAPAAIAADDEPFGLVAEEVPEALAKARDSYTKGVRAARGGLNGEALKHFEAALPVLAKEPGSDLFFNLVSVAKAQRAWAKVLLYGHGFLARETGTKDAAEVAATMAFATERLSLHNPPVEVTLTAPEGAEVSINAVPVKPGTYALAVGRYQVDATQTDFEALSQQLVVEPKTPQTVALTLKRATYFGKLAVETTPKDGVEVFIDGRSVGRTPLGPLELLTGRYLVRFETPGYDVWSRYVQITKDGLETLKPVLERTPTAPQPVKPGAGKGR